MGTRQEELRRALGSLGAQRDADLEVVVVGNGWEPVDLPAGVRSVGLPENVGVPEGRNVGAQAVSGDVLLFFDDDLEFCSDDAVAQVLALFERDPALAVVQPRAVDPAGGATARRHIPRLRVGAPDRPGDVVWFWEGCSFVRRAAFDAAGGWPGRFFYGHEGIELGWRVIDAGWRIRYEPAVAVRNPPAAPFRRPEHQFTNARNRVWVARRNLPHPLLELYLLVWVPATLFRAPGRAARRAALRGFVAGVREPAGERRPISWAGAWRMTRLGRPPIV